ncbi:MAG: pseudouridine synthase, partial [Pseudomonadota bacterium]
GQSIPKIAGHMYIALNKPRDVLSDIDPDDPRQTVHDLVKVPGHLFAVGRLDYDSEGLILMTNDGELANRLMHPRYEVEREYAVRILGELNDEQTQRLLDGISIAAEADEDVEEVTEDRPAKFDSIDKRGGEGANQWYHVVLREGRNREVRKLFEAVGLTVSRLIRVRFGKIGLPPRLTRGRMLELDQSQVRAVLKWVGMEVEGHIGALPTNNQPNRGQRRNSGAQVAGNGEGGDIVQRENQRQSRERNRRDAARGDGRQGGDVELLAGSIGADIVSGDAAIHEAGTASMPSPDMEKTSSNRGITSERIPRRGRGRSMRRPRGVGESERSHSVIDGSGSIGNVGNIGNINDDIGNQIRKDSPSLNEEGTDDMIGNRISPAGAESNPRGLAPSSGRGRSQIGGGRLPGQSQPRGGANTGGSGNADSRRRHSRGRRKPRSDSDNSGNR